MGTNGLMDGWANLVTLRSETRNIDISRGCKLKQIQVFNKHQKRATSFSVKTFG